MMRAAWLLALVASCTPAEAAPARTAKTCAPTNSPTRWVVAGRGATACFTADDHATEVCFLIEPGVTPRQVATPPVQPPPASSRGEYRVVAGVPSACVGKRCTKLGPRAAAAAAEVTPEDLSVTGDGKVLVVEEGGSRSAWRVDRDRSLRLAPPPRRHPGGEFGLMSIQIASGVMVATWEDCAGPCGLSTLVDSNGKNLGTWFGAGHAVGLDKNRIAMIPTDEGARFLVLDTTTGATLAAASFGGFNMQLPAVIDDHTLLVLWTGEAPDKGGIWEFHFVSAPAGKQRPTVGPALLVPWCRP